jgi:hypothetical protein
VNKSLHSNKAEHHCAKHDPPCFFRLLRTTAHSFASLMTRFENILPNLGKQTLLLINTRTENLRQTSN